MNKTTQKEEGRKNQERGRRPEPGERERVVAEWAASGKTVDQMAAETGWSIYTLYRWRLDAREAKAGKETAEPRLLAVPKPERVGHGGWAAEVTIGNGLSMRLAAGCAPRWAAEMMRELRRC